MTDIKKNLAEIHHAINLVCNQHGRNSGEVCLLAVSKTKPASDIQDAFNAGQQDFGENYLQEALEKIDQLKNLDITWHFIGSIQSNKTRPIAENFDWVHTLASTKHAHRINEQRPAHLKPLNACLQVNISHENSKNGLDVEQVLPLAKEISALENIRLRGLMVIPAPTADETRQRQVFHQVAELMETIKANGIPLDTLSMGMSADYPAAIAEGATIIRIGTAIFGKREKPA